jgi:hypothetical protein
MPPIEREKLLSQMVDHRILITDRLKTAIPKRDNSWFDLHGRSFDPTEIIYKLAIHKVNPHDIPNLEATRAVAAHYLGIVHHPDVFFRETRFDKPHPTEDDRQIYCDFIEFQTSITGLLNLKEIQAIRERGWWNEEIASNPTEFLFQKPVDLRSFEGVSARIEEWKKEGWYIALFSGSFDPPTLTHLQNATTAHLYSSITGVPLKFVAGFDSDELLKRRKGKERPRYYLDDRRQQFGRFWMIDETVVMRPEKPIIEEYVRDYKQLGIDYVVMSTNPDELATKLPAVIEAGLEIIPIPESPLPTATQLLNDASLI